MVDTLVVFEKIKRENEFHAEYWSARELAKILEYSDYRNFQIVLKKAKESCKNSGQSIKNHFGDVTDMVEIGSSASRKIDVSDSVFYGIHSPKLSNHVFGVCIHWDITKHQQAPTSYF